MFDVVMAQKLWLILDHKLQPLN